jgi:HEAT repeat protein
MPRVEQDVGVRPEPPDLYAHPSVRMAQACAAHGCVAIAEWCAALLAGEVGYDDARAPSLAWLGGAHAAGQLRKGRLVERGQDHWPRVWAARGLLYVWTPAAAPAIVAALSDPAWRVREMAAKVTRLHEVGEAADALAELVDDPVPRVRIAAVRALGAVGEAEHAAAVREVVGDPVACAAAEAALRQLRRRLDRDL